MPKQTLPKINSGCDSQTGIVSSTRACCAHLCRSICLLFFLLPVASHSAPVPETGNVANQEVETTQETDTGRLGGYKLLPIPIFITEPAIGEGLGAAIALFHPVSNSTNSVPTAATPASIVQMENTRKAPPVITGVFGAYTNSDTWAAGVGHTNNWLEDHIRYTGAIAVAEVNSQFYILNIPIKYTLQGSLVYQDIKFRLAASNYFLGMSFSFLDATSNFNSNSQFDHSLQIIDTENRNVGFALRGSYDSRDNTMNPNSGKLVDLSLWRYDDAIGGDYDYWSTQLKALWFQHFQNKFTLGLRLDVSAVDGRPPFYGYPWVKLRGIPAMRYQDESAGAVEVEGRYQLAHKWEVLGFAGLGFTKGSSQRFDNPSDIYNVGVGARYKVIEEQNVWVGLDVAKGTEEWNWYIQVGHAW